MFQPQPTPYSPFASYETGSAPTDFTIQQAAAASATGEAGASGTSGGAGAGTGWLGFCGGTGGAAAGAPTDPSLIFSLPALSPRPLDPGTFPPFDNSDSHVGSRPQLHKAKMEPGVKDEIAAQEAAARDYQPQLQGPLVGAKTPSHAITEEYAKADPVYVQKTLALPQSYSHYRPIRGDGNCGWRAIAFSYFEKLIRTGNQALVDAERLRLTQIPIIGHDEFVFEDMKEEIDVLMKDISAKMGAGQDAMAVLMHKFNDPDVANPILYYMRLLASSWLKGDTSNSEYLGFIPDGLGVQGYCQNFIELPGREIEHLGLIILFNVLLKPVGFVLEIAYLDRSPAPTANTYLIPEEANGQDPSTLGPIIYLLFRPDHYDILYREPAAPLVDIQVHRATSFTHQHDIASNAPSLDSFSAVDFSALAMIPGFTGLGGGLSAGLSNLMVASPSPLGPYPPDAQQPWMSPGFQGADAVPLSEEPQDAAQAGQPVSQTQTPALRFSEYCHPSMVETDTWREPAFTTTTFKNSHFNVAHYNNPNFQPEEYRPGVDDPAEARGTCRKRSNA